MKTIWKYPFTITDRQQLTLREGAKVIAVGMDPGNKPHLWAIVDTEAPEMLSTIFVFGTGHAMPENENLTHLGTLLDAPFVWHVFARATQKP